MSVMMVQTKCKLNNTELSASLKLFHIRAKKSGTTRTTRKQQKLKNGPVRFRLNIDIRKEMEDSRLNAIKQPILLVKGRLKFSSNTTTAVKIPLTESLLDNWLKNNHFTVDKIYYLRSLFVSFFFFTNFSFPIYFLTAENGKTEFCGSALKLDLIE